MKYVIEIFENGDRTDVLVSNDKYNWDGYAKLFSDKKCSYVKKGYYICPKCGKTLLKKKGKKGPNFE